jgi:hypothetical protein
MISELVMDDEEQTIRSEVDSASFVESWSTSMFDDSRAIEVAKTSRLVRPVRAQSCGAKRPFSAQADEEEKRRKVDEAMVVEDAVNDGVIMPAPKVNR